MKHFRYSAICLLVSMAYHSWGQTKDSLPANNLPVVALYNANVNAASLLFNGPEYYYNDSRLSQHAFLETATFDEGSLVYEGLSYTGVPLAYDILRDEVVTLSFDKNFRVKLIPEKLTSFILRGNRFIKLDDKNLPRGFYQLLYDGRTRVLAKRTKKIKEITTGSYVEYSVYSEDKYFVYRNKELVELSDKASVLAAFPDKKNELSAYIDQSGLSFKVTPEQAYVQVIRYYDQIAQ